MAYTYEDFQRDMMERQRQREENARNGGNSAINESLRNVGRGNNRYWVDSGNNVNISNLDTGETRRATTRSLGKDSVIGDIGQSIGGAMGNEFGGVQSLLATGGLAIGGLLHGDNHWQPEVGSALWRLQEGSEAKQKAAARLSEDAAYGRGELGKRVMQFTGAASTYALERALDVMLPGAGTTLMYTSAAGNSAEDARQRGLSLSTQVLKAAKSGAMAYLTENLSKISGLKGAGGEGLIDGLFDKAAVKIANKGGNVALMRWLAGTASEGAEEILEDYFNYWGDKFLKGVVKGDYDVEELPDAMEIAWDGIIGALLGGFGGINVRSEVKAGQAKAAEYNQSYGDYLQDQMDYKRAMADLNGPDRLEKLKKVLGKANTYVKETFNDANKAKKATAAEVKQEAVEAPKAEKQQTVPSVTEKPGKSTSETLKSKVEDKAQAFDASTISQDVEPLSAEDAREVLKQRDEAAAALREEFKKAAPNRAADIQKELDNYTAWRKYFTEKYGIKEEAQSPSGEEQYFRIRYIVKSRGTAEDPWTENMEVSATSYEDAKAKVLEALKEDGENPDDISFLDDTKKTEEKKTEEVKAEEPVAEEQPKPKKQRKSLKRDAAQIAQDFFLERQQRRQERGPRRAEFVPLTEESFRAERQAAAEAQPQAQSQPQKQAAEEKPKKQAKKSEKKAPTPESGVAEEAAPQKAPEGPPVEEKAAEPKPEEKKAEPEKKAEAPVEEKKEKAPKKKFGAEVLTEKAAEQKEKKTTKKQKPKDAYESYEEYVEATKEPKVTLDVIEKAFKKKNGKKGRSKKKVSKGDIVYAFPAHGPDGESAESFLERASNSKKFLTDAKVFGYDTNPFVGKELLDSVYFLGPDGKPTSEYAIVWIESSPASKLAETAKKNKSREARNEEKRQWYKDKIKSISEAKDKNAAAKAVAYSIRNTVLRNAGFDVDNDKREIYTTSNANSRATLRRTKKSESKSIPVTVVWDGKNVKYVTEKNYELKNLHKETLDKMFQGDGKKSLKALFGKGNGSVRGVVNGDGKNIVFDITDNKAAEQFGQKSIIEKIDELNSKLYDNSIPQERRESILESASRGSNKASEREAILKLLWNPKLSKEERASIQARIAALEDTRNQNIKHENYINAGNFAQEMEARRDYIGDRGVPVQERLEFAKDMDEIDFRDAVDNFIKVFLNRRSNLDADKNFKPDKIADLEKELIKFINNYETSHAYTWDIVDGEIVKNWHKSSSDSAISEVIKSIEDSDMGEQIKAEGFADRTRHKLSYDVSEEKIAAIIAKNLESVGKTKDGDTHGDFAIVPEGGNGSPYRIYWAYNKNSREPFTIRLMHTDSKAENGVRLDKYTTTSAEHAAELAAKKILNYENGEITAKEAYSNMTRKQILKELEKQSAENILKGHVDYDGTYNVGDFTVEITKSKPNKSGYKTYTIAVSKDGKFLNGNKFEEKWMFDSDHKRKKNSSTPIDMAATCVEDANFQAGNLHLFDLLNPQTAASIYVRLGKGDAEVLFPTMKKQTMWVGKSGEELQEVEVMLPDFNKVKTASNGEGALAQASNAIQEAQKVIDAKNGKKKTQRETKNKPVLPVRESHLNKAFDPSVVEVDGKLYNVTVDYASEYSGDSIKYFVTPYDNADNVEADVGLSNASTPEEAVRYALDKNLFKDVGSDESIKAAQEYEAKKKGVANEQGNDSVRGNAERNDGVGNGRGAGDNQADSGAADSDNAGGKQAANGAVRQTYRTGQEVSVSDLTGGSSKSEAKTLKYVGEDKYTPEMKRISRYVRALTMGRNLSFVTGEWADDVFRKKGSKAIACTAENGDIVFNLDYFKKYASPENTMSRIALHESFHSLCRQHSGFYAFAKKAFESRYGSLDGSAMARDYAIAILGKEQVAEIERVFRARRLEAEKASLKEKKSENLTFARTSAAQNEKVEYPQCVYEELLADAFGNVTRFKVDARDASKRIKMFPGLANKTGPFRSETEAFIKEGIKSPDKLAKLDAEYSDKNKETSAFEPVSEEEWNEYNSYEANKSGGAARNLKNEKARKQRAEDKATFDGNKGYAEAERARKKAEKNRQQTQEERDLNFELTSQFFGKEHKGVLEAAKSVSEGKTFVDGDEFRDKETASKHWQNAAKEYDDFKQKLDGAANNLGDLEELAQAFEGFKDNPILSEFYSEDVQKQINLFRELSDQKGNKYNEAAIPHAAARMIEMMSHNIKRANEVHERGVKMNSSLAKVASKIAKSDKAMANIARFMYRWQVNPDTVFKWIDGFAKNKGGEGYKLAKEMRDGLHKHYQTLIDANTSISEATKNAKDYEDFVYGKQTIKDHTGKEWEVRRALNVVRGLKSLASTGVKLTDIAGLGVKDENGKVSEFIEFKDGKGVKLNPYDLMHSLEGALTDAAKAYSEGADNALKKIMGDIKNTHKALTGIDLEMIGEKPNSGGYYHPTRYVTKDGQEFEWDIAKSMSYNAPPSFTKERTGNAGAYLVVEPVTDVIDRYFRYASNYVAYAEFADTMHRLNMSNEARQGLGSSMANAFGKEFKGWMDNYVQDIGTYGDDVDTEGVNTLLRGARHRLQQGALLFSVSVPMKQISSYWAASSVLHMDSLAQAYRPKLMKPLEKNASNVEVHSRKLGNLEQSAAEAASDDRGIIGRLKRKSKAVRWMANAINQMDYNTVSNLYTATEYDVLKYQFNGDESVVDTEEYRDAVDELFQEVVMRTQPIFDKQARAEYGRTGNEVIRMLSMFRTQQTQNFNMLATAIGEYNASKGTENEKEALNTLERTAAGQIASAVSLSILTIIADFALHRRRKYEDEEGDVAASKIAERFAINAIEASAGTAWFGSDAAKWLIDKVSGGDTKEFYGANMGALSTLGNIIDSVDRVITQPNRYNAKYAAGQIATIFGIPLNNAYAMLNSLVMYAKDAAGTNEGDYDDILKYLDAQAKEAKKEAEKAAKAEAKVAGKTGADILAEAASQKPSQTELNAQEEQKESKPTGYLSKPYNALVEAGMSSQQSKDTLAEMDTDGNNSVKQSEMIAYYKAHPEDEAYVEAMWNSYGYKTTWEAAKKKAG